MTDDLFRKTLDWFMCADPWPFGDDAHRTIQNRLENESRLRGYDGWIDAHHRFKP